MFSLRSAPADMGVSARFKVGREGLLAMAGLDRAQKSQSWLGAVCQVLCAAIPGHWQPAPAGLAGMGRLGTALQEQAGSSDRLAFVKTSNDVGMDQADAVNF